MSLKFFSRLGTELPDLFRELRERERKEFDEEVERVSMMDCDLVAEVLDRRQFRKVAEEAMTRLRKKRQEVPVIA